MAPTYPIPAIYNFCATNAVKGAAVRHKFRYRTPQFVIFPSHPHFLTAGFMY